MISGGISGQARACNCIGPQNGEPLCPCQMRGIIQRDGKWIRPESIIGDVRPAYTKPGFPTLAPRGCICPAGAEKTCKGIACPRRAVGPAA